MFGIIFFFDKTYLVRFGILLVYGLGGIVGYVWEVFGWEEGG